MDSLFIILFILLILITFIVPFSINYIINYKYENKKFVQHMEEEGWCEGCDKSPEYCTKHSAKCKSKIDKFLGD